MRRPSIVYEKSMAFANRIVKLYKHLCNTHNEYTMIKQLLRSGTSIGANICEAIHGMSKKDFLSKMYIAYKECAETRYWLDILLNANYLTKLQYDSIAEDCNELLALLTSITKSTRNSINNS